jgi:hypothetical protein
MIRLRLLLLSAALLGLLALSGRPQRAEAQGFVDMHPVYQVPLEYGSFRQFLKVNDEHWTVFEARDGTLRVVKMRGLTGKPDVMVEIQRR